MVFMAMTVVELVMTVAQVTMVELDGRVMEVVREWMPGVAGGALDCHVGERHNIVTGSQQSA